MLGIGMTQIESLGSYRSWNGPHQGLASMNLCVGERSTEVHGHEVR